MLKHCGASLSEVVQSLHTSCSVSHLNGCHLKSFTHHYSKKSLVLQVAKGALLKKKRKEKKNCMHICRKKKKKKKKKNQVSQVAYTQSLRKKEQSIVQWSQLPRKSLSFGRPGSHPDTVANSLRYTSPPFRAMHNVHVG